MATRSEPSTESVIALLDHEIDAIVDKQNASGWTPWALYTAIAALLGYALSTLENGSYEISNVYLVATCACIIFNSVESLRRVFSEKQPENKEPFRAQSASRLSGFSRTQLIAHFAFTSYLIFISAHLPIDKSIMFFIYKTSLWSYLIFLAVHFVASYPNPLLPDQATPPGGALLKFIAYLPSIIVCLVKASLLLFFASVAINYSSLLEFNEWRLGLCLFGILKLTVLLSDHHQDNSLTPYLQNLRRRLSFAKIRPEEALKEFDLLYHGIHAIEMLKPSIIKSISVYKSIGENFDSIHKKILKTKSIIESPYTEDKSETINGLQALIREDFENFKILAKQLSKTENSLRMKSAIFLGNPYIEQVGANEFSVELSEIIELHKIKKNTLAEEFKTFDSSIQKWKSQSN